MLECRNVGIRLLGQLKSLNGEKKVAQALLIIHPIEIPIVRKDHLLQAITHNHRSPCLCPKPFSWLAGWKTPLWTLYTEIQSRWRGAIVSIVLIGLLWGWSSREVIKSERVHYGRSYVSGERCLWGWSAVRWGRPLEMTDWRPPAQIKGQHSGSQSTVGITLCRLSWCAGFSSWLSWCCKNDKTKY